MANATKIYSIQANYDSYKSFVLSNPEATLRCKGKPLNWTSPQAIEIDEEDAGVPEADIALLNIGSFIVNESVKNVHFDQYKTFCEFLPLDRGGKRYFAVNVINVIECLDNDKSTFNEYGGVVNPVFDLKKIPEVALFKIKEDNFTNIFCTEAVVRSIEKENLTGALFEEYTGTKLLVYGCFVFRNSLHISCSIPSGGNLMDKVTECSTRRQSKSEPLTERARRILQQYDREMDEEPQYSGHPKNLNADIDDASEK